MSRLMGGNGLASVLALALIGFMAAAAYLGRISWVSVVLLFIIFCFTQWRLGTGRVPASPQNKPTIEALVTLGIFVPLIAAAATVAFPGSSSNIIGLAIALEVAVLIAAGIEGRRIGRAG